MPLVSIDGILSATAVSGKMTYSNGHYMINGIADIPPIYLDTEKLHTRLIQAFADVSIYIFTLSRSYY